MKDNSPDKLTTEVEREDAIREFTHHDIILQQYRAMFLVTQTFLVTITATLTAPLIAGQQATNRQLVAVLSIFGLIWLVCWLIVSWSRALVVKKYESIPILQYYHERIEKRAHSAGIVVLGFVFPTLFLFLWIIILGMAGVAAWTDWQVLGLLALWSVLLLGKFLSLKRKMTGVVRKTPQPTGVASGTSSLVGISPELEKKVRDLVTPAAVQGFVDDAVEQLLEKTLKPPGKTEK